MRDALKPLIWMGSSRKDLKALPTLVQDVFGYALYLAQTGGRHVDAKPLRGFHGAVYVLRAFQKKSKSGIATPKEDLEIIKRRLSDAQALSRKETGK
jgi:phage-related protein